MKRKVFSIIGLTAISAVMAFNNPKDEYIRVNPFVQNLVNSKEPELVCHLSEDNILLKNIIDFTVLSDSTFVVSDG